MSKLYNMCGLLPRDREPGSFVKPDEDNEEPARTERLLARPFALFHVRSGDMLDAVNMGHRMHGEVLRGTQAPSFSP